MLAKAAAFLVWTSCVSAGPPPPPFVRIPGVGNLVGEYVPVGATLVAQFLGIPYGAPPTGDLRWQAPGPARHWLGNRTATAYGSTCMGSLCGKSSEDCLFLNVFLPAGDSAPGSLPVVFYIHGGAYQVGCSNMMAGASLAARSGEKGQPVVVVTVNYRLGIFGFLGSDRLRADDGSTGNFGIQDQRLAMEWVRGHIEAFGGDKDRVTIIGESAGAGSVTTHLVAQRSRGLFANGIAESGLGAIWSVKPLPEAEGVFATVLSATGCAGRACLVEQSATVLYLRTALIVVPFGRYITWSPVVDGVELTMHPYKAFQQPGQHASNTPVLAGTNRDEYAYFFVKDNLAPANATQADFNKSVMSFVPDQGAEAYLAEATAVYTAPSYPYPNDLRNYSFWWWASMRAVSDHEFTCASRRTLRALSKDNPTLYSYFLTHPSSTYIETTPCTGPGAFLVPHTVDLPYVFDCANFLSNACAFTSQPEQQLATDVSGYWVSFATKPEQLGAPWVAYESATDKQITLDVPVKDGGAGYAIITDLRDAACDFWDRVAAVNL
eukprot:gene17641-27150_t